MRGQQTAGASVLVLVALTVAGCGGASSAPPEPTGQVAQVDASGDAGALDVAACAAVSDAMTIVENADIALTEGRMAAQEQQGWYAVATRVLDRIPSTADGPVGQGVADLKEAAPAVDAGSAAEPVGIRSDAWNAALASLDEPCGAAGAELAISMFTGG